MLVRTLSRILIFVVFVGSTSAHVTLEQTVAAAGAPYRLVLRVPHGCEGSPTVRLRVTIPEGIIAAKPMPKAGWHIEIRNGQYQRPYAFYHGIKLTEGAQEISWTGKLADEHYDEFVIAVFVAKELKPAPVYFPVIQDCETHTARWVEIPAKGQDPHSLKFPAPVLNVGGAAKH